MCGHEDVTIGQMFNRRTDIKVPNTRMSEQRQSQNVWNDWEPKTSNSTVQNETYSQATYCRKLGRSFSTGVVTELDDHVGESVQR
jgi:hypothetical protein